MSIIDDCLAAAVKAGTLSDKGAAEYRQRMKDAEALAAERGIEGPAAYVFATTEAAKAMEKAATSKRAQVQQTILAIDGAWAEANAHKNGLFRGLETVFGQNVRAGGTGASVETRRLALLGALQRQVSDLMEGLQSKAFGLSQNRTLPQATVSALYGVDKGDAGATAAAKAWSGMIDWWHQRMGEAGVPIGKMEDWRLPQHFDPLAVHALGKEGFAGQMEAWWRDGKLLLRDWKAEGEALLRPGKDDARVAEIFERAYQNITTDGAAFLEPGAMKSSTLGDKYGRRRAFEWATDEAWLEFNRTMGVGDDAIGELMVRHIDHMARDLALAQTLGPDPDRAAKILLQMAAKAGVSKRRVGNLDDIYFHSSGKAQTPVSDSLALAGQTLRSGLGAVQLGSAVLASVSDFAFTKATASWNGLSSVRIMGDYVAQLATQGAEGRVEAMRRGLIQEVGLRGLHDAARDAISDTIARSGANGLETALSGSARVAGRAVEVVMRAQGLAHHTQVLRDSFGMEFQAHFHDLAKLPFAEIGQVEQRTLERYGITPKEWDILRTKALDSRGFLDPAKLAVEGDAAAREAGLKMIGAIAIEQRIAVPEGNVITRAYTLGQSRPGTLAGEALRSAFQYKGFAMSAGLMQGWRMVESLADGRGQWFRGQYIAALTIEATVAGAISLQLKDLAAGKDPEPMFSAKNPFFWAKAAAQGGAGGIIGDQLKAFFSTKSSGDAARLLSPSAALLLMDAPGLVFGNVSQSLGGEKAHFGKEMVSFANKYTPDVWYTRLAMDRLVWDTLQRMVDPDAAASFQRMQDRARKEQGTEFWWRPGSTAPRAPDIGRAFQ